MSAIYNEVDAYAADWLEVLSQRGHIASGRVERRSVAALNQSDVAGGGQRHFFAGIGGWSLALRLAGVADDADVWTGSCPCQPYSVIGRHGGKADPRHLWPAWRKLIGAAHPSALFGEQVGGAAGLAWLDDVRADLEADGYAFGCAELPACGVGAPHRRNRIYFCAFDGAPPRSVHHAERARLEGHARHEHLERGPRWLTPTEARSASEAGRTRGVWAGADWYRCTDGKARAAEPGTFPMADGVPARVGKLRGFGNAIVPQLAAAFIQASIEAQEVTLTTEVRALAAKGAK